MDSVCGKFDLKTTIAHYKYVKGTDVNILNYLQYIERDQPTTTVKTSKKKLQPKQVERKRKSVLSKIKKQKKNNNRTTSYAPDEDNGDHDNTGDDVFDYHENDITDQINPSAGPSTSDETQVSETHAEIEEQLYDRTRLPKTQIPYFPEMTNVLMKRWTHDRMDEVNKLVKKKNQSLKEMETLLCLYESLDALILYVVLHNTIKIEEMANASWRTYFQQVHDNEWTSEFAKELVELRQKSPICNCLKHSRKMKVKLCEQILNTKSFDSSNFFFTLLMY